MHNLVGWDIGGAHVKAALVDREGKLRHVIQYPCPLWQGIANLHRAIDAVLQELSLTGCLHALTMTGELVDLFASREEGVAQILDVAGEHFSKERTWVFAGKAGILGAGEITRNHYLAIASANWLASATYCASRVRSALFVDIGSTTTDILTLHQGRVDAVGCTDFERLKSEELIYTGIVRTPVMALTESAFFDGARVGLMAEHFATTADVYRLCGELPEHADLMPAADGGEKTMQGSRRRLARMVGLNSSEASDDAWKRLAHWLREKQLQKIQPACQRQLSRGVIDEAAPLVGAGVGRFLVKELASRLARPYSDWIEFFPQCHPQTAQRAADCAPATALACLAWRKLGAG